MDPAAILQARLLSAEEVQALAVETLGLDPSVVALEAPEVLSALVRRAASFIAPCSPRHLQTAVLLCFRGIDESEAATRAERRADVEAMIEALTSYGDLLELPAEDPFGGPSTRMLYLAPPTYVKCDGVVFLLGGGCDGSECVPGSLRNEVQSRYHTRRLRPDNLAEVCAELDVAGWVELRADLWLAPPTHDSPEQLVARADAGLKPIIGAVAGLTLLDPFASPTYYRGRWVEPARRTGRFVARREQRYMADNWSYVQLANGVVTHLVDLPFDRRTKLRPCDVAWHLQMAMDAVSGCPQVYRYRQTPPSGSVIVDFFSPVPHWARRRWDVLGEEVPRHHSLFAYRFPTDVILDVERTLHAELFMSERAVHRPPNPKS